MNPILAFIIPLSGNLPDNSLPPGFGGRPDQGLPSYGRPDQGLPGYGHPDQGLPGHGHPGNALPIAPVRPSPPIVLPPITTWPPQIPNLPDNALPPGHGHPSQPIVIPPDPSIGISQPIYLPQLPPGTALLIALTGANVPTPKGVPEGVAPAILYQGAGTKPVLVYVSVGPQPKSSYEPK
jgi:hypothetical protein